MIIEESILLIEDKKTYFEKIKENYKKIKEKIITKAEIIYNFKDSWLVQILWLEKTGFPFYLKNLLNVKIYSFYKLLLDHKLKEDSISNPVFVYIINITKSLL